MKRDQQKGASPERPAPDCRNARLALVASGPQSRGASGARSIVALVDIIGGVTDRGRHVVAERQRSGTDADADDGNDESIFAAEAPDSSRRNALIKVFMSQSPMYLNKGSGIYFRLACVEGLPSDPQSIGLLTRAVNKVLCGSIYLRNSSIYIAFA